MPFNLSEGTHVDGQHCYSHLDATTFDIRGPTYLKDKKKVKAEPSVFTLMHVDIFCSNDRMGNLAAREDSWLRKARAAGDTRYYMVVVYVTPALPYVHLIIYYAVDQERIDALPHFKKLWSNFTNKSPEFDGYRNDRWKVIPRVAEGSWMISKAVGTKPAMLAQKLAHHWILVDGPGDVAAAAAGAGAGAASDPHQKHKMGHSFRLPADMGPGPYIEGDCDVLSSNMAFVLVSMLQQYAKHFAIDLGFAIEPRTEDECPEVVMAAMRLSRVDVTKPPLIEARPDDFVLGKLSRFRDEPPKDAKTGKK